MQSLNSSLDTLASRIRDGEGTSVVSELCEDLCRRGDAAIASEWAALVATCQQHRIHSLLLEDPYTARAFNKPRGYAGDAEMLDFLYTGQPPPNTSAIGRDVFKGTTGLPNGLSVVARRDLLAERIDAIAAAHSGARVLSIACGHLREAQLSAAVLTKSFAEFVALDQDARSLAVVSREQASVGVTVVQGSVADIIRRRISFRDFDLVYAAGLFDYLTDAFAKRLLELMFDMLNPGGRLVVANFTPENHGRRYMECFMDWSLTCRSESQMEVLMAGVKATELASKRVYRDQFGNIVYLEVERM